MDSNHHHVLGMDVIPSSIWPNLKSRQGSRRQYACPTTRRRRHQTSAARICTSRYALGCSPHSILPILTLYRQQVFERRHPLSGSLAFSRSATCSVLDHGRIRTCAMLSHEGFSYVVPLAFAQFFIYLSGCQRSSFAIAVCRN